MVWSRYLYVITTSSVTKETYISHVHVSSLFEEFLFVHLVFTQQGLMLLNIIARFTFLLIFYFYFKRNCWRNAVKILETTFPNALKSRERKVRSGAEGPTLPKCNLFTQMFFLKDSILNCPTRSNVISNSQSASVKVSSLPRM